MNSETPNKGRQTEVPKPSRGPAASDRRRSRLGDITRPIDIDRRLASTRRSTIVFTVLALVVVGAFSLALFGLPIRTYFGQDEQLEQGRTELEQMNAVVEELRAEVERARTDDGIREAAREQLGMVEAGEQRRSVLDGAVVPTVLPAGWPYDMVTQIVNLRREAVGMPPITSATSPVEAPTTTTP